LLNILNFTIDNSAREALFQKYLARRVINFSEHGGWTLRGSDQMRLGCHLIVSSLSRFVNKRWQDYCEVGTESTALDSLPALV